MTEFIVYSEGIPALVQDSSGDYHRVSLEMLEWIKKNFTWEYVRYEQIQSAENKDT